MMIKTKLVERIDSFELRLNEALVSLQTDKNLEKLEIIDIKFTTIQLFNGSSYSALIIYKYEN